MSISVYLLEVVMEKTHLSRPSIYRLMKEGNFPFPVEISKKRRGWLSSDIDAFIKSRPYVKKYKGMKVKPWKPPVEDL